MVRKHWPMFGTVRLGKNDSEKNKVGWNEAMATINQ